MEKNCVKYVMEELICHAIMDVEKKCIDLIVAEEVRVQFQSRKQNQSSLKSDARPSPHGRNIKKEEMDRDLGLAPPPTVLSSTGNTLKEDFSVKMPKFQLKRSQQRTTNKKKIRIEDYLSSSSDSDGRRKRSNRPTTRVAGRKRLKQELHEQEKKEEGEEDEDLMMSDDDGNEEEEDSEGLDEDALLLLGRIKLPSTDSKSRKRKRILSDDFDELDEEHSKERDGDEDESDLKSIALAKQLLAEGIASWFCFFFSGLLVRFPKNPLPSHNDNFSICICKVSFLFVFLA